MTAKLEKINASVSDQRITNKYPSIADVEFSFQRAMVFLFTCFWRWFNSTLALIVSSHTSQEIWS